MAKYLNDTGLSHFYEKLLTKFAIAINPIKPVSVEYSYVTPTQMMVSFTVPTYTNDGSTVLEVYINGMRCVEGTDYTLNGNVVNITKELKANQVCHFVVSGYSQFYDGLSVVETEYVYTTTSQMNVTFTVPAFNTDGSSTLDVYINGLRLIKGVDYTMSGKVVTIIDELDAGQTCHFVVRRLNSVAGGITDGDGVSY